MPKGVYERTLPPKTKTHCKNGHEYASEGVYWTVKKDGSRYRYCKPCCLARIHRLPSKLRQSYNDTWRKRSPVVHAWTEYRRGAKDRGFEFNLDRRHFEDLLIDNCFYCGAQPNPVNGIDRVDTHAGYVDDNVVTACAQCNRAKLDHSLESFLSWVQRAAAHQSRMGHAELIEVQAVAA